MKKSALIPLLSILILGSCYSTRHVSSDADLRKRLKDTAVNYHITLDGIDSTDAAKMKMQFLTFKGQDKRPQRETFWFSKTAILRMYNLLTIEQANEKALGIDSGHTGFTDGVRIYFVSDIAVSKGHLANSIILVATKNADPDGSVPSGAHHTDYYTHSKKDILFRDLGAIQGQWSPHNILKNWGQNLYNFCSGCNVISACDTNKPHYITQLRAHNMVHEFSKRDTIITKSEWFDYNLIKDLATDTIHDGIRIYIARHPNNLINGKPDSDSNKEAFIWVTTRPDTLIKTAHDDYYDCQTTHKYFSNYVKSIFWKTKIARTEDSGDGGGGNTPGGQDNGEICPNHCD